MAISVKGKTVVLTGTLTDMERKEAEALLKKKGARCTSSVSKNTDMVFAGVDAGSKVDDAEALDIPVYREKELFAIIGKPKAKPKKPAKKPSAAVKKKAAAKKKEATRAAPAGGGKALSGKTVVITGTLSQPRAKVEALLKKAGARVTGSVSANTHYLVAGADAGSKLDTAQSLGVTVITEAQMQDLVAGKAPSKALASSDSEDESASSEDSGEE